VPTGSSSTFESKNWLSEFTLNYNRTFNRHKVQGLLGYTVQKEYIDNNTINGTNFPNDIIRTINAAGLITSATSTKEEWALLSYLARLNYSYDGKYLLTAALRRDGSSRFGSDNRWGLFPSLSLGWRLSEENFMKNVSWISDLKLRASYGLTGNNFISNYGHIGLTIADNYVFGNSGGSVSNGIRLNNIPNSELGWEKNRQMDAGFELAVLGSRLTLVADYYNKRTSDLLLSVPVPTLTGYSNALQNIGEIENRGFEFAITSRNTTGKFRWTTDLNFSTNRVKVTALGPDGSPIIARQATSASAPTHITQIGDAPGAFFGYQVTGVYQNDAEAAKGPSIINANGTTQSRPGHLKFLDVNDDGEITADDRTVLGDPFPDFTYGITNTFSYNNFDLAFTLQGVQGVEVLNLARRYYGNYAGLYNVLRSTANGWRSESQPGDGITPMIDRNFNAYAGSTVINNVTSNFVENGSFLRIRNITLGYSLPQEALRTLRINNARFSFTVQNAYTFTRYEGYNPEVSAQGGSPLVPGVDAGGYPLARSFNLGINIGF
jgi:TonB-linked SusC/RagA family outer membrane protein